MNRSPSFLLPALLLAGAAAQAQTPDFGDLAAAPQRSRTVVRTDTSTHRDFPLDGKALDADLAALSELLAQALGTWAELVEVSERCQMETVTDLRPHVFQFRDLARYRRAIQVATTFSATMLEAQTKVRNLEAVFREDSLWRDGDATEMFVRHARVLEAFTLFDTLVDWGSNRSLDFDTMALFDERDAWILEPKDFAVAAFPPVPARGVTTRSVREQRSREGGLVTERRVEAASTWEARQAPPPEAALGWIEAARVQLRLAREHRTAMLRLANDVSNNVWTQTLRLPSAADFEAAKKLAAQYALAAARLKGARNALTSLVGRSDLGAGHVAVRAGMAEVERAFQAVARWGSAVTLNYSDRRHPVFTWEGFGKTFLVAGDQS